MPLQPAVVRVQRDDRVGVEVVAGPLLVVPVGSGVADAPIRQVQRGIVRAGHPDRTAAVLPRFRIAERRRRGRTRLPRITARFVRRGNRVEAPCFPAAPRVEGRNEPADPILAAADTDDDLVFDDQRGVGDRITRLAIGHFRVPQRAAGLRVDGNEMGVERAHVERVAENRQAAVVRAAADDQRRVQRVAVDPEDAAGLGVERDDVVQPLRQVHDAVDDQRCGLPVPGDRGLVHPFQLEVFGVCRRNLRERAVALTEVAAGVHQPVPGFLRGICEAIRTDLRMRAARHRRDRQHDQPDACLSSHHGHRPFRESRKATTSASSFSLSRSL